MKQRFLEILDQLPELRPRSRLEPYKELIRQLRQRQRSYREITRVLAEHCGVRVCHSTLHEFVERHLANEPVPQPTEKLATPQVKDNAKVMQQEPSRRIATLERKPDIIHNQPARFQFDGSEPLQLNPRKS